MTKINKIVMKGFKSFGRRTELLFGNKYNCVLGPNGSGKSNVLDSICFVLGKSGTKSLRTEKASNLIYNGGKTKKPAKEGEVSIYFDNSKGTFPTEDEEVKVSRIVKHKGQSTYRINDKVRTRQQVLDLLSIAKIDPNGYNIILQGDIIKLIDMSGDEKRKIVEEIAGISVYEEKKNKAMNELEKVDAQMRDADIIMKERGTYLRELKGDRDKAIKYKDLVDREKSNKATLLHLQIKKKDDEKTSIDDQIGRHKSVMDKHGARIGALKKQIGEKDTRLKEITSQVEEKGEKGQVALQKEIEHLKVDIATDKNRISSIENEIGRLGQRKSQLQQNLAEIEGRTTDFDKEKEDLLMKKSGLLKEQEAVEEKIKEFKAKNKIGEESEEIEREIDEADRKGEEKQAEAHKLRAEQQDLLREKDRLEFQVQAMDEKIRKVNEVEKEHRQEVENLKKRRISFKEVTIELNSLLDRSSVLSAESGRVEEKLFRLRDEMSKVEARNAGLKEQQFGSIAVKNILQNRKKFKGIHGTVAQLGNVSSRYSIALEVAAGQRINSIVVENDQTAADCIKYLRQNRLGTATFLPLNKIKEWPHDQNIKKLSKSSGVHGLAIDLVEFEPRFRKVFSYVFGNTLVVNDIDTARRIGIGNARMASLSGDLAEPSGAMHGGFRQSKTSFREKDVAEQAKSMNNDVNEAQKTFAALQAQKKENEEKIIEMRERKAGLEGEIIKTERGLHLEEGDLDATKRYKEELTGKIWEVDKKLRALQDNITEANRDLAVIKAGRQKLKDRVSQLKNPRLLAELNAFEEKKQKLREEAISVDSEIKGIGMQIEEIFGRDRENTIKILKGMDKETEGFEKEKGMLDKKISRQSEDLRKMEEKQEIFYSRFKLLFGKRNRINDEIAKADKEIAIIEEKCRGEEKRMNTLSIDLARVKGELAGMHEEFAPYTGIEIFKGKDDAGLRREINECERMKAQFGGVNLRALEIYETVETEYKSLLQKKERLVTEREDVETLMAEIEGKKKDMFMGSFDSVNEHFQRIFSSLTTKGEAFLELENRESPFEGGLDIRVRLTGNKFMDLRGLSGGEKSLTALAFIFAVQEHDPASFYVFDEVDAALDKHNSEKLAKLFNQYSEKAQYVIITHNDAIVSEAETLYGVSMDEHGISNIVSLKI